MCFRFKRRLAFTLVAVATVSCAYVFLAEHSIRAPSQEFTSILTLTPPSKGG